MLYAQIRSGTITGTVTDATGAVIAGAEVTLTEQQTNAAYNTQTTAAGMYTFPYLPAGIYTVSVKQSGFVPYRETGINLSTGQTARADIQLKVGAVQEAIEVSAQVKQIQTDNSTVQGSVQTQMIDSLPNITQNPLFYAMLQAGVVPSNASQNTDDMNSFGIGVDGRRQFSAMSVNGGRPFTNDIQLDGIPVMGGGYNETSVVPNTEGLSEVRVIANNFSAEYGRGQSVISMNTKSGVNEFHGQATYMMRNEALNANGLYNNMNNISRPAFKVHDFGGAVGGRIIRDKLFFHSSYHQLRHDRGTTSLMTVPTALEKQGDFSQSFIKSESGAAIPARTYDPYNVTQVGADLYQRQLVPNAQISNPNASALLIYGYYPSANRTPDDAFNTNNYSATIVETVRRHSLNNRVDYLWGKHSIYGSGGISYAEIVTPRPFGESPFNGASGSRKDNNPYVQVGDTIVLTPTTVVDIRYGVSRINTRAFSGDKEGFTDYDAFGVPKNLQSLMLFYGVAPNVSPNTAGNGVGGGSNWVALTTGNFNTKKEGQLNHSMNGSVSKVRGRWTHKFGAEFRNLLSNYADPEEGSVVYPSPWHSVGNNFNFEYLTADGSVASQTNTNAQRGINAARMLYGTGLWWIRPGSNVAPAFSQKYFAIYSQNDWRATSKLTINLGLRWDLQPGPTERHDRMSSWDLTATSAFGTQGAVAFPGVGGYSRNLWDTQYDNWGPRFGIAYQLNDVTVVRGGFGITYLPSNTGYFSSPVDYGAVNFSSGVNQIPYGTSPNGVPVYSFSDSAPLAIAVGADDDNPQVYGLGESRFDRHYKNGRAMQWNAFVERRLKGNWMASIGYSASKSNNLMNRSYPINSLQQVSASTLADWRAAYIASNGTLDMSTQQVDNPWQPDTGDLLLFRGVLAGRTIARQYTQYPYPLLVGSSAGISMSKATADYHSLQLRVDHPFANGFMLSGHYTWSKEIDNTDNMADNQGFNAGGTASNPDVTNLKNNRHIGLSDIPHRFVGMALYQLPFGKGKPLELQNRYLRAILGDWQISSTFLAQAGSPLAITLSSSGGALNRADRIEGVAVEVPKELQRWYDGKTTVTLPNGRQVTPTKNTFLKYYSGAFTGRYVTTANGSVKTDVFWFGTAAQTYDDIRTPGRFNVDAGIRRTFKLGEKLNLEVGADAMNVLNSTQINLGSSYNYATNPGTLGSTSVTVKDTSGNYLYGQGSSGTYGSYTAATFNPRQLMLRALIRF